MKFYNRINKWYEKIFPLNMKQVEFVKSVIPLKGNVLEVGSAKGYLTHALSTFYHIKGIDLDDSFVKSAKEAYPHIDFKCMDMLDIGTHYKSNTFDGIICFGNTLVHLKNTSEIDLFLKSCYKLLKEEGTLMIQIINYDRILDQNIMSLPTIHNHSIEFTRTYKKKNQHLEFNTTLKVKESNEMFKNSVTLYPIRKQQLEDLLIKNGFRQIQFQSSFERNHYDVSFIPLIISCKK